MRPRVPDLTDATVHKEREEERVVAVERRLAFGTEQGLEAALGARGLRLATEDELAIVFNDCERGAHPPFGRPCF